MNLESALLWMFIGSLVIGIYLNGMNVLADDFSHLYFSSPTLIYSAVLMASLMSILEVIMHYNHVGEFNTKYLVVFLVLAILMVYSLREQVLIGDKEWLKRMISHHSTAITTSKKIKDKTNNKRLKNLASSIIEQQLDEIDDMEDMLNNIYDAKV